MQNIDLRGKRALVTGGSQGIGAEICRKLAANGADVFINYYTNKEKAELLVSEIKEKYGVNSWAVYADVANSRDVRAMFSFVDEKGGVIDVLVNNAGLGVYGAIEEVTMEDAYYQYDVNLFGVARVTKSVLPHMREQKSGTIINISSVLGETYGPLAGWYLSTKHALEGWSDALRVELKEFDIDVVIVQPGAINTNFFNVSRSYLDKYKQDYDYVHLYGEPVADSENSVLSNQSEPIVIAKVINKAINARNPKTRYAAGAYSKLGIFLRRIMTDKMFDRFILFIN